MRTTPAATLTLRQLNRATLARQMLLERHEVSAAAATEHLVAVQAQLARPPFVGLWSRIVAGRREVMVRDLLDKRLVRGTSLRGTLHVMSAEDFKRFRPTLQPALDGGIRMLGARIEPAGIAKALAEGSAFFATPHTFDAFRIHLAERFPESDIRAMAYAVRMQLPLLQVPTNTAWGFPAQADFVSAEAWLGRPPASGAPPEELVIRYLTAYGPATLADVQAWSGLGSLRPVLDAMRGQLLMFHGEGKAKVELFDLPNAPRPPADVPAPVRFLPDYDNAIVGRADARLIAREHRSAVFLPGLRVLPTFLVDGFVAGTWKIERKGTKASLIVVPFAPLTRVVRQEVEYEGERLLRFVEPEATTSLVVTHPL